ncbi:MAG: DUF192 domain-containing protein [Novosphingobium sp.]|nr:DUF192 domain-containing protein [Novosphingobium sp.]
MNARLILAAFALALAGCKGESAVEAPAVHAESGLSVVPLAVTSQGKVHRFRVELAQTAEQQAKGLMFRTKLGPDEGMIFPMNPPRPASFWMRNTVIPLDLLFVAPDGTVLNIAASAKPYDETQLTSAGPVKAVLELPGGRAAELGIAAGDRVQW